MGLPDIFLSQGTASLLIIPATQHHAGSICRPVTRPVWQNITAANATAQVTLIRPTILAAGSKYYNHNNRIFHQFVTALL
jgi:hypothetical protein